MTTKENQLIALRTGTKPAERSGEYWSKEDIQLLEQRYYEGSGISDIALQFGRSEGAVCQQLTKMGLLTPQGKHRTRKKEADKTTEYPKGCLCHLYQVKDRVNCKKECPYAGTV